MIVSDMLFIQTQDVSKSFKDVKAVDNINLSIEEGECFGLLGPNGAGKTTLIRLITAISSPTTGRILVAGRDVTTHSRETKAILGVVPQIDNLDEDLTVSQNLSAFARYFSIPRQKAKQRTLDLLQMVKLEEKQNSKIKTLSGGMRRRLLIARGLVNEPKMLILDEPTVGLDPQARHLVWQKLGEFKASGITQLLCTQTMEEAAILCDRVAIMNRGRIVGMDKPHNLIQRYAGEEVLEIESGLEWREKIVRELTSGKFAFVDMGDRIRVFHAGQSLTGIFSGMPVEVKTSRATLEDVFFLLTGEELG
jgi:lipooligosaccharide transport system ATP-binding protein